MIFAVLARRAVPKTIGEGRFEALEVRADDVGVLVYRETRQMLADAGPHDPGFAMVNAESFFHRDRGCVDGKALGLSCESLGTGESQIIGIAGVVHADGIGEPGKTAIQTITAKVG